MVTSRIRLIALDIDGTLLTSQFQISDRDNAALQSAHEQGIQIVLCTGRRHDFAMPIAEMLGFPLWLISCNGAVTKSTKGELFHKDFLPCSTARELCAYMRDFRDFTVLTFDRPERGALVLERTDRLTSSFQRWLEKNAQFIELVVPVENALVTDPVQAMFCGDIQQMKLAEKHLLAWQNRESVTILKTEYLHRDLCVLDILNRNCSKGHALERFARARGLDREQVMAIGDNHNDVEMLRFSGFPFIMGNACEELKRNGWTVTLSNDECGVAAAIEQALELEANPSA